MNFLDYLVSDVIADRADAVERGLVPAEWPVSGDAITVQGRDFD